MAEKKTEMVLKVDLQCPCCYKKVKRILCKYPEIRDQRYDEKANTVSIIVITCCPEKIRDKLCCKGGKVIKSIEIKEPPKPKPNPEKPKEQEKPKGHEKPKDQEKPKDVHVPNDKPKGAPKPKEQEMPKDGGKPKEHEKPKDQEKPKPAPAKSAEPKAHPPPQMVHPMPGMMQHPMPGMMQHPMPGMVAVHAAQGFPPPVETGYMFMPSYGEGYHNGPSYHGYGVPIVAAPSPFDYYGQNNFQSYGGYEKPYVRDDYFSEENSQGCFIM